MLRSHKMDIEALCPKTFTTEEEQFLEILPNFCSCVYGDVIKKPVLVQLPFIPIPQLSSIQIEELAKLSENEFTYELLANNVLTREIDYIQVKGKSKPVKIYEVIALPTDNLSEAVLQKNKYYAQGLNFYRQQLWDEAIKIFEKCLQIDPDDTPSKVFVERCKIYKANPVPADWDGVFELKSK